MALIVASLVCVAICAGYALFMDHLLASEYTTEGKCMITAAVTVAVFFTIVIILTESLN